MARQTCRKKKGGISPASFSITHSSCPWLTAASAATPDAAIPVYCMAWPENDRPGRT
ncbi:unnamed protein product [Chondrus crispus]|uniref:Uncharacterized protein n=1 Tax=Chondrus crispus TaxID=2769 RepID=R7QAJ3_CHOCR|nr:unnamed protein product [Chondrus crispus]CDF34823.1 unnamed protein product [Chondrus crispus]|eukprot:XP_005714642.1 unnamed protein product [Chondrus crispus]